jgi:hypothetical protein
VSSTGLTSVGFQVLGDLAHRSDRRARLKQLLFFALWFACIHLGGVALVQGELACVQGGALCVFRALVWWFVLFA